MENIKNEKSAVALSSVFAGLFLTVTKFIVGLATGSIGIMSEAAHSFLDLVSAIMTYVAVKLGDRPADDSHPYGHGKIESLSALAEAVLLLLTSVFIVIESIKRLLHGGVEIEATWYAFVVVGISIVIDISRSRALLRVAKATNSQALEADALHFTSDIYSSLVVLVGLVFVRFGFMGADAIAAIGVAVFVLKAGYDLAKRTIDVLIDTAPTGISEIVRTIIEQVEGVLNINNIRVRPLGPNIFIEIFISVHRKLSLPKTHEIVEAIRTKIHVELPDAEVIIHAEPIVLDTETIIDKVQSLAAKNNLTVHKILTDKLNDKLYVSFDVEMPDTLTIETAHNLATSLEGDIQAELGEEVEVNSHIEPIKHEAITSSNVSQDEQDLIAKELNSVANQFAEIKNIHNTLIRKINDRLFISFHCDADKNILLEKIHDITSQFEFHLRDRLPQIKRVVIHVEPLE